MQYHSSDLPLVYILTALVSVIAGAFYNRLEEFFSIEKLLQVILLFLLGIVVVFLIVIEFSQVKESMFAIMVFKDVVWMFAGLEFGMLIGLLFNIRQSKRLFGLLASGEILAGILGGLSVSFVLRYIQTVDLLFISATTFLFSFFLLLHIIKRFESKFKEDASTQDEQTAYSYKELLQNRYYLFFFIISALSFFVFYLIDYVFYFKVENIITDEKELAHFFGIFFAILNAVNLFSSVFLSGRLLSKFGVGFGLMAIPALALLGSTSLILTSLFAVSFVFVVVVALKILDEVFDISILTPTFRVLYQPINLKEKMKVITFRETIIEPCSVGLVGVFLFLLGDEHGVEFIYIVLIALAFLWLFYAVLLKQEYVKALKNLLAKRKVFSKELLFQGVEKEFFENGLQSSNEIEVLYCLDVLEKVEEKLFLQKLRPMLSHQSKRVRLLAIRKIKGYEQQDFFEALEMCLAQENDALVMKKLLCAYCKIGKEKAVAKTKIFCQHRNILVQEGALIGLLKYTGEKGFAEAASLLNTWFNAQDSKKQKHALNVLRKVQNPHFFQHLQKCLVSKDIAVKKLAILVVGHLRNRTYLMQLLEFLEDDNFRQESMQALIQFGKGVFSPLLILFQNSKKLTTRFACLKICASFDLDLAQNFLLEKINEPLYRDITLEALSKNNFRFEEAAQAYSYVEKLVTEILQDLHTLDALNQKQYSNSYLIIKELKDKKVDNLFLVLSFVYSQELILQAHMNYKSRLETKKAFAIELLDNILEKEIKKIALPILEQLPFQKIISFYEKCFANFHFDEFSYFKGVLEAIHTPTLLKMSLLYEFGCNNAAHYIEFIENFIQDEDKLLHETASWSYEQIHKKGGDVINH